jgi:uncharacterized protein (TIGR00251 family)
LIDIVEHADGALLSVLASPGAKREGIVGVQAGALKVAVRQPPEDGKANKAIAELLAKSLGLHRRNVELVSGPTHRQKQFLVRGVSVDELREMLAQYISTKE